MTSIKITEEEFLVRFHATNPSHDTIIFLSPYVCLTKKRTCQCTICGHIWEAAPSALSSPLDKPRPTTGCPKCNRGGHNMLTQEEFIERVNSTNRYAKYIQVTSQYQGSTKPIDYKCVLCGTTYTTTADCLQHDNVWCKKCKKSGTSFMEIFLLHALKHQLSGVSILHRDTSAIGAELDIYIPDKNFAIEIGSWLWHFKRVARDHLKYIKCRDANIELLTIYDSYSGTDQPFPNCRLYPYDLGTERGYTTLKDCVNDILATLSVNVITDDAIWDLILSKTLTLNNTETIDNANRILKNSNHPDKDYLQVVHYTKSIEPSTYLCLHCNKEFTIKKRHIAHPVGTSNNGEHYYTRCPCRKTTYKEILTEWFTSHPDATLTDCMAEFDGVIPKDSIYYANKTFKRPSSHGCKVRLLKEYRKENPSMSRAEVASALRDKMSYDLVYNYWGETDPNKQDSV